MTYSILSLASGNILESYEAEDLALQAAYRICDAEPVAFSSVALVTFDDHGMPVYSLDGDDLAARLGEFAAQRAGRLMGSNPLFPWRRDRRIAMSGTPPWELLGRA
jgi:hypothetical protein